MRKIVVVVMLLCLLYPLPTKANEEITNVKDCIDGKSDCTQMDNSTPLKLNQSNDMLVENEESPSFIMNIIKMFFALVLILVLLYIILVFLKRKNYMHGQEGKIHKVGGLSLAPNKSVQCIKIGEKVYMLGVGDNVQLLEEITDQQTIQQLTEETEQKMNPANYIPSFLKNGKEDEDKLTKTLSDELKKWSNHRSNILKQKVKDDRSE